VEPVTVYGNPDITRCMEYLRSKLPVAPDGSVEGNRRYCHLLLRALEKDYPGLRPADLLIRMIDIAHGHTCRTYATSMRWLYYNKAMLISLGKQQRQVMKERSEQTSSPYRLIRPTDT